MATDVGLPQGRRRPPGSLQGHADKDQGVGSHCDDTEALLPPDPPQSVGRVSAEVGTEDQEVGGQQAVGRVDQAVSLLPPWSPGPVTRNACEIPLVGALGGDGQDLSPV